VSFYYPEKFPTDPDFLDLPWHLPFSRWQGVVPHLVEVSQGVARHSVLFVNYQGRIFALKEMPFGLAEKEFHLLRCFEGLHLPVVSPVCHLVSEAAEGQRSVLITRYLEQSVPYRRIFMHPGLKPYRRHLLDAMAGLIVQLHLAGVFWGDCSLSNTLFRRDAGALRAYLVDAETSEFHENGLPPTVRFHDLQIMEENVNGELIDLRSEGLLPVQDAGIPISDTGAYIRLRYRSLWEEISREVIIQSGETYKIQERINALNDLGFSVREVLLEPAEQGDQLFLRAVVTDRNFHHDHLLNLTGLEVEEMQARKMMNEIHELKATLSRENNRSTPLSVAAYHWIENIYIPVTRSLEPLVSGEMSLAELYCQVLEHKWYLSEKAGCDIGHLAATEDYIRLFG
jgi:hypothetical protein